MCQLVLVQQCHNLMQNREKEEEGCRLASLCDRDGVKLKFEV